LWRGVAPTALAWHDQGLYLECIDLKQTTAEVYESVQGIELISVRDLQRILANQTLNLNQIAFKGEES